MLFSFSHNSFSTLATPWTVAFQALLYIGFTKQEPTCQCRKCKRHRFDPWVRKTPEGGHGNPLCYSCLENPMDRGAWWAAVHRVVQSQTRLKQLSAIWITDYWQTEFVIRVTFDFISVYQLFPNNIINLVYPFAEGINSIQKTPIFLYIEFIFPKAIGFWQIAYLSNVFAVRGNARHLSSLQFLPYCWE